MDCAIISLLKCLFDTLFSSSFLAKGHSNAQHQGLVEEKQILQTSVSGSQLMGASYFRDS